jgi:hypothetical protein
MNRWKLAIPVVACIASLSATGCAVREEVVAEPRPVQVRYAPPVEERVEVAPPAPSAEHIWVRGHWYWNGDQYVWQPGHYEVRRVGYRWVPAHYENRGGVYYYVQGHWAR